MIMRSIDDLGMIRAAGARIIAQNKPSYLEDLASGALAGVLHKHIAYCGGQVVRDAQGTIISGETRDDFGAQLPDDKVYFFVQVLVLNMARAQRYRLN